jgi:hypothetical protein
MFVKCIDNYTNVSYNLPALSYQIEYNSTYYGSFEELFDSGSVIAMQNFILHFWVMTSTRDFYHISVGGTVQTVTDDGQGKTTGGTVSIDGGGTSAAYSNATYIGQI